MLRPRVLALALAAALAACGGKKSDDVPKQATPPATTPPAATPPAATPPATPPAAGTELKLPLAARVPGLRWTKTDELTSQILIGSGDKQVTIDGHRRHVEQLEVVEVDAAGVVTKFKASYPERTETEKAGTKTREKPSALAGKSYVAWFEGGAIKATHDDGSAVSPEELAELTEDLDELGQPQVMDQIVAGRTWKVGEPYSFTADELARLNASKGPRTPKGTAMTLELREVNGGRAVFAMKSTMEVEGKATMKIDMNGTVNLDVATGRPVTVELGGPMEGTAGGQPVKGTMNGKASYEYVTP